MSWSLSRWVGPVADALVEGPTNNIFHVHVICNLIYTVSNLLYIVNIKNLFAVFNACPCLSALNGKVKLVAESPIIYLICFFCIFPMSWPISTRRSAGPVPDELRDEPALNINVPDYFFFQMSWRLSRWVGPVADELVQGLTHNIFHVHVLL